MIEELKPIDITKFTVTENGNVVKVKKTTDDALDKVKELEKDTQSLAERAIELLEDNQRLVGLLNRSNARLKRQIEKMKCCGNCKHSGLDVSCQEPCRSCTFQNYKWELAE